MCCTYLFNQNLFNSIDKMAEVGRGRKISNFAEKHFQYFKFEFLKINFYCNLQCLTYKSLPQFFFKTFSFKFQRMSQHKNSSYFVSFVNALSYLRSMAFYKKKDTNFCSHILLIQGAAENFEKNKLWGLVSRYKFFKT